MEVPLIRNYPAIDISCVFSTDPAASAPGIRRDLPYLRAEYQRLDIIGSAQSPWNAFRKGLAIPEENRLLHEITRKEDSLFQWVVVDPYEPATFWQAEALLASPKTLGIRLPFSLRRRDISEYMDTLLSFAAERHTAVMVLPVQLPTLAAFGEKYPNVTVLIPQLCTERLDKECFAECIVHTPNLYTDTSGSPATLNNSLEFVVETCGADRVLFGTGGESPAFEKARILLSSLSREDQEKILLHNALRVFPKLAAWMDTRKEAAP